MSLSAIGVFHTILGSLAIFCAIKLLWTNKQIDAVSITGKVYLLATLLTAGSALTIFKHGGFNAAHGLAILTILAVLGGFIADKLVLFNCVA